MPRPWCRDRWSARPGEVIGEHPGYARYTIGQRKGLPGGSDGARYVVAIHPDRREVVVGSAEDLAGHSVQLEEVNWLADPLEPGDRCEVQVRYRARGARATVLERHDGRLTSCPRDPGPRRRARTVRGALRSRRPRARRRRDRLTACAPSCFTGS